EVFDHLVHDGGGHHQPDGSRPVQLLYELVEGGGTDGAFLRESLDGVRRDIVDHALMAAAHQAPHHVGAHPAQTDHSQLHSKLLVTKARPSTSDSAVSAYW